MKNINAFTRRKLRSSIYPSVISGLLLCTNISTGYSQTITPPIKPRIEASVRAGSERTIGLTEFFVPLAQNPFENNLLYLDYRMMRDSNSNDEFNIGLGYRTLKEIPDFGKAIVGGHLWFDRRFTDNGSKFNQITAGLELKSEKTDVLLNTYIPLNSKNTFLTSDGVDNSGFVGNQILVDTASVTREEALKGIDLELGFLLPQFEKSTDQTRLYVGGYHFDGDKADNVSGGRLRLQSDITSDFSIGARLQYDKVREVQGSIDITFRFPASNKRKYQEEGLKARMDESPERDIDIVTNDIITDRGGAKTVTDATTGEALQIIHVNNTNVGGDGSAENPFSTLANAEAVAVAGNVIYVHEGDGTSTGQNNGVSLTNDRQMLIGSGSNFLFDDARFSISGDGVRTTNLLAGKTSAPVITNVGGDGVSVTGNDVFVSGVEISNSLGNGINVTDVQNFTLTNSTVDNNSINGVFGAFASTNGSYEILNNDISNNGEDGIEFTLTGTSDHTLNFSNNLLDGNTINGAFFNAEDDSNLDFVASTNTITNTNQADAVGLDLGRGIWVWAEDDADVIVDINNNNFNNNRGESVEVEARNASTATLNGSITNNIAQNALGSVTNGTNNSHYFVHAQNGGKVGSAGNRFIVSNNIAGNATEEGVVFKANTGTIYGYSSYNETYGGDDGQELRAEDGGFADAIFENNNSYNNLESGIQVDTVTNTGSAFAIIRNNTLTGNQQGVQLTSSANGAVGHALNPILIENNTISDNVQRGIVLRASGGVGTINADINNNDITGTLNHGVELVVTDNNNVVADINNNNILNSTNRGFNIDLRDNSTSQFNIDSNVVNTATQQGVLVGIDDSSSTDITLTNNLITNVTGDGIQVDADDDTVTLGSISSNTITQNTEHGIYAQAFGTDANADTFAGRIGTIGSPLIISDNTISNNGGDGMYLRSSGDDGRGYFTIFENSITDNGGRGFNLNEFDSDTLTNAFLADLGGGAYASTGMNSLFNNGGYNVFFNADIGGSVLSAQSNWWGLDQDPATFDEVGDTDGVNEFGSFGGSTLDSSLRLSDAP